MQLSCLPVSLYNDITAGQRSLADWFHFAAELGLDGADVSIAHIQSREPQYLESLRRQAESAGIPIVMLVTYSDFTHPDAKERARQIDGLKANIQVAAHLGATFLRVTAGQRHPETQRAEGVDWAVKGLTACLDEAAAAGVTLAYENHTIGYGWTYFDFSQPADIFLEIVARTEGTGLRLLFDTANNLALNDDPLAVLKRVQHRVAVIHVSDIRRAGHFEPVVLGTGVAPLEPIFQQLRDAGFDSWISVEEASRTAEAGFRQAIPYVDQIWQQVGGAPRARRTP
jgi:sugar phosphate isomerase/epimerase